VTFEAKGVALVTSVFVANATRSRKDIPRVATLRLLESIASTIDHTDIDIRSQIQIDSVLRERHASSRLASAWRVSRKEMRRHTNKERERERERERETVHLIRVRDGTVNYPGDSSLTRRKRRASSTTRTGRPERWIRITNDAGKKGRSPSAAEPHGYYSAYRGRRATFIKPCAIRGKRIVLSGRRIQSANAWHSADVNRAKVK